MGLDTVELVLSVEDEFGVAIPDADACEIVTPRMLADYVIKKLEDRISINDPRCLSQVQFYRLRSHMCAELGIAKRALKPETQLVEILGKNVRKNWRSLAKICSGEALPALDLWPWQHMLIMLVDFAIGLIAARMFDLSLGWILGLMLVCWIFLYAAGLRFASRIPASLRTIKDLVPYVNASQQGDWSVDEILPRVLQITAIHSGVELSKIHPDHHFIDDLGMG